MILISLIAVLFGGGLLAWALGRWYPQASRWVSLLALTTDLVLALDLWKRHADAVGLSGNGPWITAVNLAWIPQLGIRFHLALDGLSLLLVVLTLFLGLMSVVTSWREIKTHVGFFHFNLLWVLAAALGVFLALDLFLFAFFWEMMLVPMYLLIGIWGHENRAYAAIKFFIFTQASGLLMLVAIIALAMIHYADTGVLTFDYFQLLHTPLSPAIATWLMLGFLAAFLVKLPAVPFHAWLPDAHTQAPTAGSVILAGVLLQTGAYGLLRFIVPLFPHAALRFTPIALTIGVIGILYGAFQAFAQTDLKRLVAYGSVSHMAFILLGVFTWNALALQGSVMQMLASGLSTGALFMLVGSLQERIHTRDMTKMGGIWSIAPRMGAIGMFFAMAALGIPGLANFPGEFLTLLATYRAHVALTILATAGFVPATIYALTLVQKTFHGKKSQDMVFVDYSVREMSMMSVLMLIVIWLGVYPQSVLSLASPALMGLQHMAALPHTLAGTRP